MPATTALLASAMVPILVLGATAPDSGPNGPANGHASGGAPSAVAAVPVVPVRDHGAQARALGWSLVFAGATFGVLGGTTVLVSQLTLDQRETSDRDGLTGFRGVRAAGFVTCGVGLVLATAGVFRLWTAPPSPRASGLVREVRLAASPGFVALAGQF